MHESKIDFFVVGAQKCGTTTLHTWLEKSPEITLPRLKETHFFQDEEKYSRGAEWYFSQFRDFRTTTKIVGEVDPQYLYFSECDARIAQFARAPKFIVALRDPVSRARSHYRMSYRKGYESLTFAEALNAESSRLSKRDEFSLTHYSYLDRGMYAKQIERMKRAFPDSGFLILSFDDLFSSPQTANEGLQKICDFLEVDRSLIAIDVRKKENQASEPRSIALRNFIYGNGGLKKSVGKMIPIAGFKRRTINLLDRLNSKSVLDHAEGSSEDANEDVPPFVYETLIDDLLKLKDLVELDCSHWICQYQSRLQELEENR